MVHPMGPLTLLILLDWMYVCRSLKVLHDGFGNPKYALCPLLVNMVTAGKLGRKSEKDFTTMLIKKIRWLHPFQSLILRIAVLSSRFPFPLERGDKLRLYHQLKGLSARHELHLYTLADGHVTEKDIEHLRKICCDVTIVKSTLWQK